MLQLLLFLLLLLLLSAIVYSDFKYRKVHIIHFIGIAIISIFLSNRADTLLINCLYNSVYIFILFSTLLFYFKYIKKDKEPFWNNKIGYGDLAMLLAISPLFHILAFLWFINVAFVFSLIKHQLLHKTKDIPLAGDISLIVISCMIFCMCNAKVFSYINDFYLFLFEIYQIL